MIFPIFTEFIPIPQVLPNFSNQEGACFRIGFRKFRVGVIRSWSPVLLESKNCIRYFSSCGSGCCQVVSFGVAAAEAAVMLYPDTKLGGFRGYKVSMAVLQLLNVLKIICHTATGQKYSIRFFVFLFSNFPFFISTGC